MLLQTHNHTCNSSAVTLVLLFDFRQWYVLTGQPVTDFVLSELTQTSPI